MGNIQVRNHPSNERGIYSVGGHNRVVVESLHLSCRSTPPSQWADKNLVGVVFYLNDTINGVKIRPGYVYVRAFSEISNVSSPEGQVHGKLVRSLLNCEPSDLRGRVSGFAKRGGEWRFNSASLNIGHADQDQNSQMNGVEIRLLQKALYYWGRCDAPYTLDKEYMKKPLCVIQ